MGDCDAVCASREIEAFLLGLGFVPALLVALRALGALLRLLRSLITRK